MDSTIDGTAEAALRMTVRGGSMVLDAHGLCPSWWPCRPPSPRRGLRAGDAHVDVRAADRVYAALSLLASTFQISDETLAREISQIALAHIREGARVLALGAARAWERGDDVCPLGPLDRSAPLPGRARDLLDCLCLLQSYNLAAKMAPAPAREAVTAAIGRALVDHATKVARAFA